MTRSNSRPRDFWPSKSYLLFLSPCFTGCVRTYERTGDQAGGRDILITAIEQSQSNAYWHCRLTFQLAALHTSVMDYQVDTDTLKLHMQEFVHLYLKEVYIT